MQSRPTSSTAALNRYQRRLQNAFGCSTPVFFLYAGFCLALATIAYFRPVATFDRYLYAGAVASLRYSDPITIHRIARGEFDAQPSPFQYESVAAEPYFVDVRDNPYHFVQQLGLFRLKLGYVTGGYVLWRAGLPILVGLRLISACCLLVLGLTVLAWTHEALLAAMLLLTPPVLNMGRMVTADPLSTTMVILALFALARKRNLVAASLLLASIVVRPDNIVLVLMLLAWMVGRRNIRFSVGAIFIALAVVAVTLTNLIAHVYNWRVIMQHSFVKPVVEPVSHPILISFAGYLHAVEGLRAIPYTFMTMWILVAVITWRSLPSRSIFRDLLPLAGGSIVIRLVMFPNFDDRFFVWFYLLAGIALIQIGQTTAPDQASMSAFLGKSQQDLALN